MLIPYRVKNPPRRFPVVTIALIALNVVVFMLTSENCLVIKAQVIEGYSHRWSEIPLLIMFAGMFLHGDLLHILGNMWFLWVFGPAVEDRLGKGVYLLLYLMAGFAGCVAQAALGAGGGSVPTIGASGCIMGLLGAYWYMYSWSRVCAFLFLFFVWRLEAAAVWVISFYVCMDLLHGMVAKANGVSGGVANFAHIGGVLLGAILVWALRMKRDSADVSSVKAVHAEAKNLNFLDLGEMEELLRASPDDKELLLGYARKATLERDLDRIRRALELDSRLCVTEFPLAIAQYLQDGGMLPTEVSAGDMHHLARECERLGETHLAALVYDTIDRRWPSSPDAEMAIYRTAAILWRADRQREPAIEKLTVLRTRFPSSHLTFDAEDLLSEIERDQAA